VQETIRTKQSVKVAFTAQLRNKTKPAFLNRAEMAIKIMKGNASKTLSEMNLKGTLDR
jgi:ribosomal protein L31E